MRFLRRIVMSPGYFSKRLTSKNRLYRGIFRSLIQRRTQNPVKHLRWCFLRKPITIFEKRSILDVWQGSEKKRFKRFYEISNRVFLIKSFQPFLIQIWSSKVLILDKTKFEHLRFLGDFVDLLSHSIMMNVSVISHLQQRPRTTYTFFSENHSKISLCSFLMVI